MKCPRTKCNHEPKDREMLARHLKIGHSWTDEMIRDFGLSPNHADFWD